MLAEPISGERDYSAPFSDLKKVIQININLVEATAGEPSGRMNKNIDAESLIIKAITGAISAIAIYKNGFDILVNNTKYVGCDFPSIQVISRSCMESYLIFYWLFSDNCSEDEKEMRYLMWKAAGLFWRTKIQNLSDESRSIIKREETERNNFIEQINNNSYFKKLTQDEKENIFNQIQRGKNNRPAWKDLIAKANLSTKMYNCYSFFCDYSHSGGISAAQIKTANNLGDQRNMCHLALNIIALFLSLFSIDYAKIFPAAKTWLSKNFQENDLIKKLSWVAYNLV